MLTTISLNYLINVWVARSAKPGKFVPRPAIWLALFATAASTTLSIPHATTHPSPAGRPPKTLHAVTKLGHGRSGNDHALNQDGLCTSRLPYDL